MLLSIVVPTYNEAPNIAELVRRITAAVQNRLDAEIVFVDDSTDATPDVIREVAASASLPVRLIHRDRPVGGLGGAVMEGFAAAEADACLVMDADLQHPPEEIPELWHRYSRGDVDVVIASRYAGGGTAGGLADRTRVTVSKASTAVTRAMFPIRLKDVSDPMTGFFLIDRRAIEPEQLRPRGFKILLEILARRPMRIAEVPFDFADRHAGESKASMRQGLHFLTQLTALRFGKMSLFAVIGGLGAIANVGIVWALTHWGVDYIVAAIIAAEVTIIGNFLLQERFVFQDMRESASGVWLRFAKSFTFNNAEAVIRIPIVAMMVSTGHISAVVATAITLVVAFFVRFLFHSLVVYAPRKAGAEVSPARRFVEDLDREAMQPGEL
ncbi:MULTISPECIES: glycosyltransferase [Microbacterium]|uniref:Undecaprenyl-phosphate 4-deoxy-4-formamido-L-arabinose transferase n=1 Tax=Microbacterium trichothecenolyticum TaxID=69370 RepID=A0A0M2HHN8_MICTR|nr:MULTISPECIES: glycosyltransferase [Microbacterium]KJL43826.1 Undecaprenyl-phosphate 4-deoxy-4-formamido-L-arabinose transferase [Microbacterium trichothecenolyticum]MDR7191188.1 dolichol-phosphate mannosyltransferase [Microbacterium sp. BE35]